MDMSVAYRIQLRRSSGWRIPASAVKVDRSTKWGNPFLIGTPHPRHGRPITREDAVALYREALIGDDDSLRRALHARCSVERAREELRGRVLACWCAPDQACHADILLEIANRR